MAKTPKKITLKEVNKDEWGSLYLQLEKLKQRVPQAGKVHLYNEAQRVKEMAFKMAPHDEGFLERAIQIESFNREGGKGQLRNSKGQFESNTFVIGVDLNAMADDNMRVGDYALDVNDYLPPAVPPEDEKSWKKGKGTIAKQKSTGIEAGGDYMKRAWDWAEAEGNIIGNLKQALKRRIKDFIRRRK